MNILPTLTGGASATLINDLQRLHLQQGPIDLIIDVDACEAIKHKAFSAAVLAFDGLLESLVSDLKTLRQLSDKNLHVSSDCATAMVNATAQLSHHGLTPMAAVAGAVADYILDAIKQVAGDARILVNNGGDIAVHLCGAQSCSIGIVPNPEVLKSLATIALSPKCAVGGIASSGWRGRSYSRGIADSVTVLAGNAANADAIATAIANAVSIKGEFKGIKQQLASELDDDTDLGEQYVTVQVDPLPNNLIYEALAQGKKVAETFLFENKLISVCMHLQGVSSIVGDSGLWLTGLPETNLLENKGIWRTV